MQRTYEGVAGVSPAHEALFEGVDLLHAAAAGTGGDERITEACGPVGEVQTLKAAWASALLSPTVTMFSRASRSIR